MATVDTRPYRYRGFKRYILLVFPFLAVVYFGFWSFWDYARAEWIFGILAILNLVCVVIFVLLQRYDGQVVLSKVNGKTIFTLELATDPYELENMESVEFKVVRAFNDDYQEMEMLFTDEGDKSQT